MPASPYHGPEGKVALVLAGGGLTGAVYEMGALRAIDDLLVDRSVNDFDIYVGTSAGAIVSALLANDVSPRDMIRAIGGRHPTLTPLRRSALGRLNVAEFLAKAIGLPVTLMATWLNLIQSSEPGLWDILMSLSDSLPSGLFDNAPLEQYLTGILSGPYRTNDFRELDKELYIVATDLDTGGRAVFSRDELSHVPISRAVAASAALPIMYRPVQIEDVDYIDGGIRGTASIDVAIEHGAKLVVVINPSVPFDNSLRQSIPLKGQRGGHLSEKGFQAVWAQVFRTLLHSGLKYHIKQLERQHKDVDIILIEPRQDDVEMFFYDIMHYATRLTVAQHGFESVTLDLAQEYNHYKTILARHGIEISRRIVIEEIEAIRSSQVDPEVVRAVLEEETRPRLRPGRRMLRQLSSALDDLDGLLGEDLAPSEFFYQGPALDAQ